MVAVAIAVAVPRVVAAQNVVYTNGVPDNVNGLNVSNFAIADNFVLIGSTTLGSFDWYVLHAGDAGPATISSGFFWQILADAGGSPGAAIASGTVSGATGTLSPFFCCVPDPTPDFQAYLINVALGNLVLGAGNYWLAIEDYTSNYSSPTNFWSSSNGFAGNTHFNDGTGWQPTANAGAPMEVAFTIYDNQTVIPEPASLALLATGLVGLGSLRRRFSSRRNTAG